MDVDIYLMLSRNFSLKFFFCLLFTSILVTQLVKKFIQRVGCRRCSLEDMESGFQIKTSVP